MPPRRTCRWALAPVLAVAFAANARAQAPAPTPVDQLPRIDAQRFLAGIERLASDEFEGRLPGTAGEERTVRFLVSQFEALGLEPGNTDGTYVQKVPLVGITPTATRDLTVAPLAGPSTRAEGATPAPRGPRADDTGRVGEAAGAWTARWRDDYVAWSPRVVSESALEQSELVFVGYGVQAPEFEWDDYKGMDLTGKTLVVLVGDPPVPDPANPSALDSKVFGGRAMTYYGRWTYKYEIGAAQKAAGVLIVHETAPAGYPWSVVRSFVDERFDLRTPDRNMGRVAVEGWVTRETAGRLFAMAGKDYEAAKRAAATRQFAPVPLGIGASVAIRSALRDVDSRNVIARLDGADPSRRDEYVVYTAHWDHLGVGEPVNGDPIYNGAVDNATGTSGLIEVARAFTRLPTPPARTVLFLAVTAEEQGLLGAQYYAEHPIHPLERTLANINMDALNVVGRTSDVTVIGLGNSDLDDYVRAVAAEQGRTVRPDAEPEKGSYYRSDHFNFAKQGVPALYVGRGTEYLGKPPGHAQKVSDDYTTNRYHKPQDEVQPTWDLSGAVEDLQLLFAVGLRVANAERWPEWKPGTEFKAKREAMLRR